MAADGGGQKAGSRGLHFQHLGARRSFGDAGPQPGTTGGTRPAPSEHGPGGGAAFLALFHSFPLFFFFFVLPSSATSLTRGELTPVYIIPIANAGYNTLIP